jgi:hypothetical protein
MPELKEVFDMVTKQTEPDLDSWNQQEQRQRRTVRNRKIGAFALVAALGVAAGLISMMSGPQEDRTVDVGGSVVDGTAVPTNETMAGVWLNRGPSPGWSGLMAQFGQDGSFAFDAEGELGVSPANVGTYEIDGRVVTFTSGFGGDTCSTGESFSMRVGVRDDGQLLGLMLEAGCGTAKDTEFIWTRVSPASDAGIAITTDATGALEPPTDLFSLRGTWLLEGTGHVLRIDWSGTYAIDDAGQLASDPFDEGSVELNGRRLTLTSDASSRGCDEGARWVWGGVVTGSSGEVMRGSTREDGCGHSVDDAELIWIRISAR